MTHRAAARTGDIGQVANVEVLPFGLLVVVVGLLLAANLWASLDAKVAAQSAARQAIRSYVEAPSAEVAATSASISAREAIASHGRDPARLELSLFEEGPGGWRRCVRATAVASYRTPAAQLPFLGTWGELTVEARHSELVDPHRAGVPGEAC